MAKRTIPVTVLIEVDTDEWARQYHQTPEEAAEDYEAALPELLVQGLANQKAWGLVTTKTVDLLEWAAGMQATKVIIPGAYYDGIEAERESWTDALIAILTGEELA